MRYAVISDVHANLEALNAVLKKIDKYPLDKLLFLGDSVGYGPNPNECVEILKEKTDIILAGNHDRAAVGMIDITNFNPYARAAIEWTHKTLTPENRAFLKTLPLTAVLDTILLVHSTPNEPELWRYLNRRNADMYFHLFKEKICFVGHSHEPAIIECSPSGTIIVHRDKAAIKEGHRYIINAGSVGQPRDNNPEAAYTVLQKNSIAIKRVSYDIVFTQKKMKDAELPLMLIERLSKGV